MSRVTSRLASPWRRSRFAPGAATGLAADGDPRPDNDRSQPKPGPLLQRLCSEPFASIVMALVLLGVFPWAMYRAVGDFGCDLQEFIHGGNHVLDHASRHPYTALDRYLPSLDVACILLTILPLSLTAAIWYFFNAGTWFGLLRTVRDCLLPDDDPQASGRGTIAAGLLTLVLAVDGFLIAAFHVLMIWLMVAGLAHASRDRHWKGGALLGLAIWLKLLPVMGAGYLLLKGKWRPAVIAILLAVAIDCALSVAAFGWRGAWDEHLRWADWGAAGSIERQMHGDTYINEDRITNQSLIVVLRRFLTARAGYPQLAMADLSPKALSIVTGCAFLALGAAVLRDPTACPYARTWRLGGRNRARGLVYRMVLAGGLELSSDGGPSGLGGCHGRLGRVAQASGVARVAGGRGAVRGAAGPRGRSHVMGVAVLGGRSCAAAATRCSAISIARLVWRRDQTSWRSRMNLRLSAHRKRSPPRSILSQSKLHGLLIRQTRAILC